MFLQRLKHHRKRKGLTQQNMADFLSISRQGYGKYEKGESEPDHNTTKKLAAYFEVTTDYLLGKTDEPHVTESDKKNALIEEMAKKYPDADIMFDNLAEMTVEQLKEVDDFIKFKLQKKEK